MKLGIVNTRFAEDVKNGLSANEKYLSSQYFYDERGDKIFQEIMRMEEYYLTNCEYEILSNNSDSITHHINKTNNAFDLVELGAGDGFKTKLLLEHLMNESALFKYIPIDISNDVLKDLEKSIKSNWSNLPMETISGTYFEGLKRIESNTNPKLILFLGSNIGNFEKDKVSDFLNQLHQSMSKGDMLLLGVDLKKDPNVILNAYNDSKGITKAFNLNLLRRINNELGANFDLSKFTHYPTYDPIDGSTKSYLISNANQSFYIEGLDMNCDFKYAEPILMEVSNKYDVAEIELLASSSGFIIEENYFDCKHWYLNTLLKKR